MKQVPTKLAGVFDCETFVLGDIVDTVGQA